MPAACATSTPAASACSIWRRRGRCRASAARRPWSRAARSGLRRSGAGRRAGRAAERAQARPDGSTRGGRGRQHLRLRRPVPGPAVAAADRRAAASARGDAAGRRAARRTDGGHRRPAARRCATMSRPMVSSASSRTGSRLRAERPALPRVRQRRSSGSPRPIGRPSTARAASAERGTASRFGTGRARGRSCYRRTLARRPPIGGRHPTRCVGTVDGRSFRSQSHGV